MDACWILVLLIVVSGYFALAEMPLASARRSELLPLADNGGLIPVSEMKEKLTLRDIPDEDFGNFHTLGGFVLTSLGRIPKKGEFFEYAGWRFEVIDVDQNRGDEVLASPINGPTNPNA